jgi:DNA-binding transcriptional regulator LsrR (DeoR family)
MAARLYFVDGRGQDDIAKVLGTSRSNVSRMLSAARRQGIVEIRVHGQVVRDLELERGLRLRFGLVEARVVAFSPGADVRRDVGELAAQWLGESVRDGSTLALSWGSTLQAMVSAMPTASSEGPSSVEVVPLVGGLSATGSLVSAQELVRELADRLGGRHWYLHAPALCESPAARDALLAEPAIQTTLNRAAGADLAVVGVGTVGVGSSQQLLDQLRLTPAQLAEFHRAGPVGDLCCQFFDANGHPTNGPVQHRVLAVPLPQVRRIRRVVAVVAGRHKAPGVLGALRGKLINGVITDAGLAHTLLATDDSKDHTPAVEPRIGGSRQLGQPDLFTELGDPC